MVAKYKYNYVNYLLLHLRGNANIFIISLYTKVTRSKKNITREGIIMTINVLKRNILAVIPQEIGIFPEISC